MAGSAYSYAQGDIINVKSAIGKAWIDAGIAESVSGESARMAAVKNLAEATDKNEKLEVENTELKRVLAEKENQIAELLQESKSLADATEDNVKLEAENTELKRMLADKENQVEELLLKGDISVAGDVSTVSGSDPEAHVGDPSTAADPDFETQD